MRKVNWFMAAATAALLLSAGYASAGDSSTLTSTAPATTASPAAAGSATNSDADEVVCKSMAPATGTRLGSRRICQTQREWQAQEAASRDMIQHEQNRGSLFSTPAG